MWPPNIPKLNFSSLETHSDRIEGGLCTKSGIQKKWEPGKPLISIITVVRNGEQYLEQTIRSVLNQTYENIEHIIVDGGSADGTLDIIRRFENRIAYWMSEPDEGIYHAMNKGSRIASGDYALYLNADDYLYRNDSIEQALRFGLDGNEWPLLIVGKVIYAAKDKLFRDWVYPTSESQIHRYNPPHQATLIGLPIYKQVFYNHFLKLRGDYDFWAALRLQGLFQFKYVDSTISVFRLGGVSNNAKKEYFKYVEKAMSRYIRHGDFSVIRLIKDVIRAGIKSGLASILGERLYYRFILYNAYRFRRSFLRDEKK